jgi:hypothetical protein
MSPIKFLSSSLKEILAFDSLGLKIPTNSKCIMASIFFAIVLLLGAWNLLLAQEAADRYGEEESAYDKVTLVFGIPLVLAFLSPWLYFPSVWLSSWLVCRRYKAFFGWIIWPFIGPVDLVLRILSFFGKNAELPRWMKLQSPDLEV